MSGTVTNFYPRSPTLIAHTLPKCSVPPVSWASCIQPGRPESPCDADQTGLQLPSGGFERVPQQRLRTARRALPDLSITLILARFTIYTSHLPTLYAARANVWQGFVAGSFGGRPPLENNVAPAGPKVRLISIRIVGCVS